MIGEDDEIFCSPVGNEVAAKGREVDDPADCWKLESEAWELWFTIDPEDNYEIYLIRLR